MNKVMQKEIQNGQKGGTHRWMRVIGLSIILFPLAISCAWAQRMDNVAEHSKYIQAVDEYVPAPGQWVNVIPEYEEGDTPEIMAQKCTESIAGDYYNTHLISLGGWGGYVTFHFDDSIANFPGQRDFAIWGNAYQEMTNQVFGGMNEAGIVMVSKDVNGNGKPDDPWYELSGSCDTDSTGKVLYNYEVTYHCNPMDDIPWTDNQGNSGTVDRLYGYDNHNQEYYPLWLPDGLTFRGTRLPDNMVDLSETVERSWSQWYYVLMGFRYGYADNLSNWTDKSDANSWNYEGCGFDISWAVDENRQPVSLDFIDFVRVYTGLNQKCPAPNWWGETSTEIQCAEDIHLDASLQAIQNALAGIETLDYQTVSPLDKWYDLSGRKWSNSKSSNSQIMKGVYIRNGKKYILK